MIYGLRRAVSSLYRDSDSDSVEAQAQCNLYMSSSTFSRLLLLVFSEAPRA